MDTTRGLSRIELAAVIGVLGVIVVLGFVVCNDDRERTKFARGIHCLNNLKQVGLGLTMYMSDSYYGVPPAWTANDDDGPKLACALGRLYAEGAGIVSDESAFSCPARPCRPPEAFGPKFPHVDDARLAASSGFIQMSRIPPAPPRMLDAINHVEETSYSLTRRLRADDSPAKIIAADKGDGHGNGKFNHDDGQNGLYNDQHVKFVKTTNPDDDTDDSGLYRRGDAGATDTWMD